MQIRKSWHMKHPPWLHFCHKFPRLLMGTEGGEWFLLRRTLIAHLLKGTCTHVLKIHPEFSAGGGNVNSVKAHQAVPLQFQNCIILYLDPWVHTWLGLQAHDKMPGSTNAAIPISPPSTDIITSQSVLRYGAWNGNQSFRCYSQTCTR